MLRKTCEQLLERVIGRLNGLAGRIHVGNEIKQEGVNLVISRIKRPDLLVMIPKELLDDWHSDARARESIEDRLVRALRLADASTASGQILIGSLYEQE